jgi:hypothetical protein
MSFNSFKEITREDMIFWIAENKPEKLEWFRDKSIETRKKTKKVYVLDDNGEKIPTGKHNKNGEPIYKAKFIPDEKGGEIDSFNMMKAKKEFCKEFMPELLPKKQVVRESAEDLFKRLIEERDKKSK